MTRGNNEWKFHTHGRDSDSMWRHCSIIDCALLNFPAHTVGFDVKYGDLPPHMLAGATDTSTPRRAPSSRRPSSQASTRPTRDSLLVSPALSHTSAVATSPELSAAIAAASPVELEDVRKDLMHSAAERARQRRLQEEAEREREKERARQKAAELEARMKAADEAKAKAAQEAKEKAEQEARAKADVSRVAKAWRASTDNDFPG